MLYASSTVDFEMLGTSRRRSTSKAVDCLLQSGSGERMRPDDQDIDDEIRAHLEIDIQERVGGGEDPAEARRAALRDLGYVPAVRESVRRVWYSRWFDAVT